jgi:hypothetical protein
MWYSYSILKRRIGLVRIELRRLQRSEWTASFMMPVFATMISCVMSFALLLYSTRSLQERFPDHKTAGQLIQSRVKALANCGFAGAVLEFLLIKLTNVEICRMFYSVPDNLIYKLILVRKILCLSGRDRLWNATLLRQPLTTSFICFSKYLNFMS